MSVVKELIRKNFSSAVLTYDEYARAQRLAAGHLLKKIDQTKPNIPSGPLLEIGCGTGFVTEGLLEMFPQRNIAVTDLSSSMVHHCKNAFAAKFKTGDRVQFFAMDGEELFLEDSYASIVSGNTFQWFLDLENGLQRVIRALRKHGTLYFSVMGDRSFPEWREICQLIGIPFVGNILPSRALLQKLCGEVSESHFEEEIVQMKYGSAKDFFSSLKKTGASTMLSPLPKSVCSLRKLSDQWDRAHPASIEVTYHFIYGVIRK